jgi:hypothetical protein
MGGRESGGQGVQISDIRAQMKDQSLKPKTPFSAPATPYSVPKTRFSAPTGKRDIEIRDEGISKLVN